MRRKHIDVMGRDEGGLIIASRGEHSAQSLFEDHARDGEHKEEGPRDGEYKRAKNMGGREQHRRYRHQASASASGISIEHRYLHPLLCISIKDVEA